MADMSAPCREGKADKQLVQVVLGESATIGGT